MSDKVRVAVAGFGIGEKAARAALRSEVAELVAVCDADATKGDDLVKLVTEEKSMDRPGLITGGDALGDLFKWGEFDALVVALPNWLHHGVVTTALAAGKHVLCEKPLSNSYEDAVLMALAANEHPELVTAMTMNNLARPEFEIIRQVMLPSIGQVKMVKGEWTRRQGIPFRGKWFSDKSKSGGGPVIDLGPHVMGFVFGLFDWPDVCVHKAWTWSSQDVDKGAWDGPYGGGATGSGVFDVETAGMAVMEIGDIPCTFEVAWGMPTYREHMGFEIVGSLGSIHMTRVWPINDGDDEKSSDALTAAYLIAGPDGRYLTSNVIINPDECPGWQDPWMGRLEYAERFYRSVAGDDNAQIVDFNKALKIQQAIRDWYASAV